MNLYDLLPGIYRRRDAQARELDPRHVPPMRALFAALQLQYDELEADIASLYADWFVETCSIAALIRLAEPLAPVDLAPLRLGGADLRAYVANLAKNRLRKGTAAAFVDVARSLTGWGIALTDAERALASTTRVDRTAQTRLTSARVTGRGAAAPGGRSAAFGGEVWATNSATVDVWRALAVPLERIEAGRPADGPAGARTFSAVGESRALMRPLGRTGAEAAIAVPFTRADARDELAAGGMLAGLTIVPDGPFAGGPMPLAIADLSRWDEARRNRDRATVFVDPELGRFLVPHPAGRYLVDCWIPTLDGIGASLSSRPWKTTFDTTYVVCPERWAAFVAQMRERESRVLTRILLKPAAYKAHRDALRARSSTAFADEWAYIDLLYTTEGAAPILGRFTARFPSFPVASSTAPLEELVANLDAPLHDGDEGATATHMRTLSDAFAALGGARGSVRIVLADSSTHRASGGVWEVPRDAAIGALSIESAPGARPSLLGSLRWSARLPVTFDLRGLNVRGTIGVSRSVGLGIESSTLRAPADETNAPVLVPFLATGPNVARRGLARVRWCVFGGAQLEGQDRLEIADSIVTAPVRGGHLETQRTTFLQPVDVAMLEATDALFDTSLAVSERARGYLRTSAVRPGERIPPNYRCAAVRGQLLASRMYGRIDFARLRADAPVDIRRGASDGSEIGAFGAYNAGRRHAALLQTMDEFISANVDVRIRYRS